MLATNFTTFLSPKALKIVYLTPWLLDGHLIMITALTDVNELISYHCQHLNIVLYSKRKPNAANLLAYIAKSRPASFLSLIIDGTQVSKVIKTFAFSKTKKNSTFMTYRQEKNFKNTNQLNQPIPT